MDMNYSYLAAMYKSIFVQIFVFPVETYYKHLHSGESKTQRKWFLDEKRDGLLDEHRVNNQQKETQQKVYTPEKVVLSI